MCNIAPALKICTIVQSMWNGGVPRAFPRALSCRYVLLLRSYDRTSIGGLLFRS